ncbi:DUF2764 family protein [Marinifilum fragile]
MDFTLFKRSYYCLISGLPDLVLERKKAGDGDLSLQFKNEITEQLHSKDYDLAKLLYLQYDNKNFQNLLFNEEDEFIPLGNYTQEYLEQQINEPTSLLEYMRDLLKEFNREIDQQNDLNKLQEFYYEYVLKTKNKFLKGWFLFDLNMKNILTAVNCKKYNYELRKHLIFTFHNQSLLSYLLTDYSNSEDLLEHVPYADEILQIAESDMDITEKEKELDLIRWKFLDEQTLFNYFTIENILAYIIKCEMVDRWMKIDDESGKELFTKLIHNLKSTYEFSEEFSLRNSRTAEN